MKKPTIKNKSKWMITIALIALQSSLAGASPDRKKDCRLYWQPLLSEINRRRDEARIRWLRSGSAADQKYMTSCQIAAEFIANGSNYCHHEGLDKSRILFPLRKLHRNPCGNSLGPYYFR